MNNESQTGISVKRVTKPSRKPAITKKGNVLIIIFNPFFTPMVKERSLE